MSSKNPINRRTWFDYADALVLVVLSIVTVFPIWNVLMISFNDPSDTLMGGLHLWFRKFTLGNYRYFFMKNDFIRALLVSVARTVIGAVTCVFFTAAFSYGVSKRYLLGQKVVLGYMLLTMYVSGGLIPTFLLIKSVGLYKNFLVYIIPELFTNYYAVIMLTYFRSIPAEIEESVKIDGGNDLVIFAKIVLPISLPILAAVGLFVAVYQWNAWFDTILYGSADIMTLQALLVQILRDAQQAQKLLTSGNVIGASLARLGVKPNLESVKATAMVITAAPIIMIYPFLQKYFVKGIMIGSLKG